MMSPENMEILQLRHELLLYRERNIEIQDHILKLNEDNLRKDEDIKKLSNLVNLCDPYGEERRRFKHLEESEKKTKSQNQHLVEEVKWFENEFEYATSAVDKYLTEEDKNLRLKLNERIELAVRTQVDKTARKHERCQFNMENLQKQYEYTARELSLAQKECSRKDVKIKEMKEMIDHLNSALTEKQDKDAFDLSFVKCERIVPDLQEFGMADFQKAASHLSRKSTKFRLNEPRKEERSREGSSFRKDDEPRTAKRTKFERK